jgi:hypothetical protein
VDTVAARKLHDDLLASRPEGASHNGDICPFCVDKATEDMPTVPDPSRSGGPDASSNQPVPDDNGGRDTHPMSDNASISQETHQALLAKAVADATSATEKALETKTTEAAASAARVTELEAKVETLETENARLNGELDSAQVSLTAANEKVATLETTINEQAAAAAKAEIVSKRTEQAKNLKMFDDEYVAERAEAWADLSDDDWASRLDEWSKLKPAATDAPAGDTASAMSGTSGSLTQDPKPGDTASESKPSARRAALGLA